MQYIKSNLIEVFPAGFRGSDYSQSKYTTEHNLTYMALISSANNMQNSLIQDPYDSDNVILNLHGYFFRFKENDLPEGTDLYAAIKLRTLETFESVLAPIYSETVSDDNFVLDVEGDFKGLAFGTQNEFKSADALLQVRDASGELIKTKAGAITTTDNVFNLDGGTPINNELKTKKLSITNGLEINGTNINFKNSQISGLSVISDQSGNKLGISDAPANCAVCIVNDGTYLTAKDLTGGSILKNEGSTSTRPYLVNELTLNQDASGKVTTQGKKLYIGRGLSVYQSSSTPVEYSLGFSTGTVTSIGDQSGDIILDAQTLTIEVDDTLKTKTLKVIGGGGGTAGVSSFGTKTGAITIDPTNLEMNGKQLRTKSEITAESFNATSDARKKENIVDYKCENSILDLPIKKFDFIDGKKGNIGCLAQDLQKICPEIVHEDSEGYLNIEESKLIYLLLQEVKELKAEVNKLKNK